eukprot:4309868-Pyramimonas_sp.AAC.1
MFGCVSGAHSWVEGFVWFWTRLRAFSDQIAEEHIELDCGIGFRLVLRGPTAFKSEAVVTIMHARRVRRR